MKGLSDLEREVLEMLLSGDHPALEVLRQQLAHARLASRENTGVGFYCDFDISETTPTVSRDFQLGDVHAEIQGLQHGAGFVLFVSNGRLKTLEGYTYDEPWPETVEAYSLRYSDPSREAEFGKLG